MKISENTIKSIEQAGYKCIFYDNYINEVLPDKAVELHLFCFEPEYKDYSFKAPQNKEITLSWVLNKIPKKEHYISIDWNKIFAPLNLANVSYYITSYGIGIETIFSNREGCRKKIDEYLTNNKIDFTNEYSEAHWVFRYKISKSKENIERINNLLNQ